MPVTTLDRLVPFQPAALLLYASLFLYIMLPSWLLHSKRDLVICSAVISGLCLAGLVVFFLWPSSLAPYPVDRAQHPLFAYLVSLDKPRNVCPSLHAAFAIFTAIFIHRLALRLGDPLLVRVVSWSWCVAILYSTLATRQHVAVDLYAGTLLGALWASAYLQFFPPAEETLA